MSGRGRGGQGVIEEMPPAEPTTADKPTPADRREAIAASKERADAKRAAKRQAQQDARSADLERARRDADSAAMQREFQGEYEGPRRNAGSIDEALAADENFGGEAERFGDIGSSGRQPSGDLSELPAFPESVEARGAKKSLDFFNANKDKYPKRIQKQIEAARRGRGSLVDAKKIDAAIKVEQTRAANRELGFSALSEPVQVGVGPSGQPVYEPSSPFTGTSKGHTPLVPGAEYERGATLAVGGRPKNLTYNGQTRTTGEPVQIDDFNFATRTPKEIKMPLALKQDPRFFANNQKTIVDQMRRQAQFAKDWNFSKYKWEMYTPEDVIAAKNIREQLPPDLAKWINITEIK